MLLRRLHSRNSTGDDWMKPTSQCNASADPGPSDDPPSAIAWTERSRSEASSTSAGEASATSSNPPSETTRGVLVEPALSLLEGERDRDVRDSLCCVLAKAGVRDHRIYRALCKAFEASNRFAAPLLADYGDPAARSLVLDAIDHFDSNSRRAAVEARGPIPSTRMQVCSLIVPTKDRRSRHETSKNAAVFARNFGSAQAFAICGSCALPKRHRSALSLAGCLTIASGPSTPTFRRSKMKKFLFVLGAFALLAEPVSAHACSHFA